MSNKVLIGSQQIGMLKVDYHKTEIELTDLLFPDRVVTVRHDVLKVIQATIRANQSAGANSVDVVNQKTNANEQSSK